MTPMFPLPLVLFPDGELRLRIFERRYLDMVRDCTRDSSPFGVLAVLPGQERGSVCTTGTLAQIIDFETLDDGLLGITCLGKQRFRVLQPHFRDNGLMLADIERLPELAAVPVAAEFGALQQLVFNMLEHLGGRHARAAREQRDDAHWIAHRIGEFFPFERDEQQWLLEQTEANTKLQRLIDWLPRFRADPESTES